MNISKSFLEQFKGWNKIEKSLAAMAIIGSLILKYLWADSWFGLSVTLTGILCVILVSKRSQWNYFWGLYNVIGYTYLAYTYGLGGDFMLNAFYFLPMQFVGWSMWNKNLESRAIVKAKDFDIPGYISLIFWSSVSIVGYSLALQNFIAPYFNSLNLPIVYPIYDSYNLYLFDSISTVLSVIAMWLMVKRYAAQWLAWIAVNVASIGMWAIALINATPDTAGSAVAMLLMWSMYLCNAIYGFYNWRKAIK